MLTNHEFVHDSFERSPVFDHYRPKIVPLRSFVIQREVLYSVHIIYSESLLLHGRMG